ncbi:ParB-like protein [Paraburkholderia hospita]|uniref:Chromosome partitioning protein ParB n=1 Tax=Paraburkholderia hospita TaxID=169430 RepID=A0AAJ4VT19_9BURK|nr:ParB-like protein [Paraburkholderia hospita]AUT76439.1 hypothetical protein C2L64_50385 [Paraburkholderia hospita]AXF06074.1 hypothetical protein CUJ88_48145 [Paraburkholderia hospita]OUL80347.1 hypothetical protein CA601_32630 [Paraburkholderia hospita]OUL80755.1 hypothetical protein CA603_31340 [Paraburkholderia hospita]OUL87710.1 hypothetical protein CA602_13315 [Paraburkholderia hospita]
MAIAEKLGPIALGPANAPYAIDHHHVATALWHVSDTRVPVVLIRDLSSLTRRSSGSPGKTTGGLTHMIATVEGWRLQTRTSMWELADDEFRSLSASARDSGG